MKNKTIITVALAVILMTCALFALSKLTDSPDIELTNSLTAFSVDEITQQSPEIAFNEPEKASAPSLSSANGVTSTRYEPVFPINISSEAVKSPVTLHYAVPEEMKKLYTELLEGLRSYKKDITFSSTANKDSFIKTLIYIRDLNPELFYIDWSSYNYTTRYDGRVTAVSFNYIYDEIPSKAQALENEVNRIVEQANKYPNLFERELFVHDYLVNNVTYLIDKTETGTAYGALINKKARCEGYARAFQLIMLRLGVPTFTVIGTTENERHMWNAVELYGNYYYVDVTLDDNAAEKSVTLYNENEISHSCFNIPEEILTKTHVISPLGSTDKFGAYQNLILPECNSYEFNYYRIRGLMVENLEQFKYVLEKNSPAKRACAFFKGEMPSSDSLQDAFKEFFGNLYSWGGYSVYYTPDDSPVFKRNVYEISWSN